MLDEINANQVLEKVLLASVTEQRRARRWGIFFKILFFILFVFFVSVGYRGVNPTNVRKTDHSKDHVALVDIEGIIAVQHVNADTVVSSLRAAFQAPRAKALIVRINSPGGSPVQSAYIYDEIQRLKKIYPKKKVYAVIADVGASGGYYIAAAGDFIYANGASIVGSIGVISPSIGIVKAMDKLGLESRTLTSGENKSFRDPMLPRNATQDVFAKEVLDVVHKQFIGAVKAGRGDRLSKDPSLFSGLYWTGSQALKLGLIDGLGSAGYVAREKIKIDLIVDYTETPSILDKLTDRMGIKLSTFLMNGLTAGPQLQ